MQSFGQAMHCVKVGKVILEPLWPLWTKQKFVEIKISRFENEARYSVLGVRGKQLDDVWVP